MWVVEYAGPAGGTKVIVGQFSDERKADKYMTLSNEHSPYVHTKREVR